MNVPLGSAGLQVELRPLPQVRQPLEPADLSAPRDRPGRPQQAALAHVTDTATARRESLTGPPPRGPGGDRARMEPVRVQPLKLPRWPPLVVQGAELQEHVLRDRYVHEVRQLVDCLHGRPSCVGRTPAPEGRGVSPGETSTDPRRVCGVRVDPSVSSGPCVLSPFRSRSSLGVDADVTGGSRPARCRPSRGLQVSRVKGHPVSGRRGVSERPCRPGRDGDTRTSSFPGTETPVSGRRSSRPVPSADGRYPTFVR